MAKDNPGLATRGSPAHATSPECDELTDGERESRIDAAHKLSRGGDLRLNGRSKRNIVEDISVSTGKIGHEPRHTSAQRMSGEDNVLPASYLRIEIKGQLCLAGLRIAGAEGPAVENVSEVRASREPGAPIGDDGLPVPLIGDGVKACGWVRRLAHDRSIADLPAAAIGQIHAREIALVVGVESQDGEHQVV